MKKSILLIPFLSLALASQAQIMFQKSYGEFFVDYGQSMVRTNDGGYCIIGGTGQDLADSTDIYVVRTDIEGSLIWSVRLAGTKDDFMTGITTTDDGGFVLVGNTYSSPLDTAYSDIVVMKIDDGGFVYWSKTFGGPDYDEAQAVIRSGDGGYIVLGNTLSYGSVTKSALAMKIDDSGNQIWTNVSNTFSSNYFYAGDQMSDGGYIAAGGTFNGGGGTGFDHYISKIDTSGNIVWSKSYGTSGADFLYDIKQTSTGGFIAAGVSTTNTAGDVDMNIFKLDQSGNVVWSYNYGTAEFDRASSIIEEPNGDIVVAGYSNIGSASNVINQTVLMKLDSSGTLLWSESYGDISATSEGYKLLPAADGYAITGYLTGWDPLGDAYLLKTDPMGESGCFNRTINIVKNTNTLSMNTGFSETVGIIDEFGTTFNPITLLNQFSVICFSVGLEDILHGTMPEIYPNPASTFLKINTSHYANGTLKIFDLAGRELKRSEFSDTEELKISTEDLLPGMYTIHLETEQGRAARTFIRQ